MHRPAGSLGRRGPPRSSVPRPRHLAAALLLLVLSLPATPAAAQDEEPPASRTYARKGAVIGGIAGGVLGGLGVGILAAALCEYECNGAFVGGFLYGAAGGGVLGGLTGLVLGAAIPRPESGEGPVRAPPAAEPEAPADTLPEPTEAQASPRRPWTVRLAAGQRLGGAAELGTADWWFSLTTLRATTDRVHFGVEAGYLGAHSEVHVNTITRPDEGIVTITNQWDRRMFSASFVAAHALGSGREAGGYLMASVGVYPLSETLKSTREGEIPGVDLPPVTSWQETTPFPGLGVGAGGAWRLGSRMGVGLDSRVHLVAGAGDGSFLSMVTLGGTVWIGR